MMPDYYESLVVGPLQSIALDGKGEVKILCKGTDSVYGFDGGNKLLVVSVHHANEIYGTYQSILKALCLGIKINAVPAVNVTGFNRMNEDIELARKASDGNERLFYKLLNDCLSVNGYNSPCLSEIIYPEWSDFNYGGHAKPEHIAGIEEMVLESSGVIDLHNCSFGSYIMITEPLDDAVENPEQKDLQAEMEHTLKDSIKRNGKSLRTGTMSGYNAARKGIYTSGLNNPTLIKFAAMHGIPNVCIEIPAFDCDRNGYFPVDSERILATSIESLSRIAGMFK